jgi:hypothetical protein
MITRISGIILLLAGFAAAQSLQPPKQVTANSPVEIQTSGSGSDTVYLVGPGGVTKHDVHFGQPLDIAPEEIHASGFYSLVREGSNEQASFFVAPAKPEKVSFLVRPSRLPVGVHDGVSGVAYVLDNFNNLVLSPQQVTFKLAVENGPADTRVTQTKDGVAWAQFDSSRKSGPADLTVSVGDLSERRVVEQVASAVCNLRISAKPDGNRVFVSTEPVRDCGGNAVPDGTIVTFTETFEGTITTVDAPIKKGIAQADLPGHPGSTISAASGVVLGNELRWGGR